MRKFLAPALLLLAATSAAEARYNCAVVRTSDGFVALRHGPSTQHGMVAKMRPQEMVHLLDPVTEEIVRSGDWLRVRWFPGTRRTEDSMPSGNEATARWAGCAIVFSTASRSEALGLAPHFSSRDQDRIHDTGIDFPLHLRIDDRPYP